MEGGVQAMEISSELLNFGSSPETSVEFLLGSVFQQEPRRLDSVETPMESHHRYQEQTFIRRDEVMCDIESFTTQVEPSLSSEEVEVFLNVPLAPDVAAVRIQTMVRGKFRFEALAKYVKAAEAAKDQQSYWKRKRYQGQIGETYVEILPSLTLLQSIFRKWLAMRHSERRREALQCIQRFWRGYYARREHPAIRQTIKKIQLAVGHFYLTKRSAIIIQRAWKVRRRWRMTKLRAYRRSQRRWRTSSYKKKISAVIRIQRLFVVFRERSAFVRKLRSVVLLQAAVRGFLVRRLARLEQETLLCLQRYYRGVIHNHCHLGELLEMRATARVLCELQRSKRMLRAAMSIQKIWRAHREKSHFHSTVRSVIFVQSLFRRHICRKQVRLSKPAAEQLSGESTARIKCERIGSSSGSQMALLQERSALCIQRHYLGFRERRSYSRQRGSVIRVQAVIRSHLVQLRAYVGTEAARVIQCHWRGFVNRQRYVAQRRVIVKLQSAARSRMFRKQNFFVEKPTTAHRSFDSSGQANNCLGEYAVLIQRLWRGYNARRTHVVRSTMLPTGVGRVGIVHDFESNLDLILQGSVSQTQVVSVDEATEGLECEIDGLELEELTSSSTNGLECEVDGFELDKLASSSVKGVDLSGTGVTTATMTTLTDESASSSLDPVPSTALPDERAEVKLSAQEAARCIQGYWRRALDRRAYATTVSLTIRLQSLVRGRTCRRKATWASRSTICIQRHYRGYRDRRAFHHQVRSVVQIQRIWRRRASFPMCAQASDSTIQPKNGGLRDNVQDFDSNIEVVLQRLETHSSELPPTLAQPTGWLNNTTEYVEGDTSIVSELEQDEAVCYSEIEPGLDTSGATTATMAILADESTSSSLDPVPSVLLLDETGEVKLSAQEAARCIQSYWRRALDRRAYATIVCLITRVQSLVRGRTCRRKVTLANKSMICIQRHYRGYRDRHSFHHQVRSVVQIQRIWRRCAFFPTCAPASGAKIQPKNGDLLDIVQHVGSNVEIVLQPPETHSSELPPSVSQNTGCWNDTTEYVEGDTSIVSELEQDEAVCYLEIEHGLDTSGATTATMAILTDESTSSSLDPVPSVVLPDKTGEVTLTAQEAARCMQRYWRRALDRRAYATAVSVTIRIQSLVRGRTCRRKATWANKSTIRIQRYYRGYRDRRAFHHQVRSVVQIQRICRRRASLPMCVPAPDSTNRPKNGGLLDIVPGLDSNVEVVLQPQETHPSELPPTVAQSTVWLDDTTAYVEGDTSIMDEAEQDKTPETEHDPNTSGATTATMATLTDESASSSLVPVPSTEVLDELVEVKLTAEEAARCMQRYWRRALDRRAYATAVSVTIRLQSLVRGRTCRRKATWANKSTICIQRYYRGYRDRRAFHHQVRTVVQIQRIWRRRASLLMCVPAPDSTNRPKNGGLLDIVPGLDSNVEMVLQPPETHSSELPSSVSQNTGCWKDMTKYVEGDTSIVSEQDEAVGYSEIEHGLDTSGATTATMATLTDESDSSSLDPVPSTEVLDELVDVKLTAEEAARCMQRYWRRALDRRAYATAVSVTIRLQSLVRGRTCRRKATWAHRSTICIQRHYRGYRDRRAFHHQVQSVVQIQRIWRRRASFPMCAQASDSTIQPKNGGLSDHVQDFDSNIEVVLQPLETHSSELPPTLAQPTGWLNNTTEYVEGDTRIISELEQDKAKAIRSIVLLQSRVRGHLCRDLLKVLTRSRSLDSFVSVDECMDASVVRIQRLWRGCVVRWKYNTVPGSVMQRKSIDLLDIIHESQSNIEVFLQPPLSQMQLSQRSAVLVQAAVRGYLFRRQVHARNEAALLIQNHWRRFVNGQRYATMRTAAIKIQAAVRLYTVSRQIWRLKFNALCIQRLWRGCTARQYAQVQENASLIHNTVVSDFWLKKVILRGSIVQAQLEHDSATVIQRAWRVFHQGRTSESRLRLALLLQKLVRGFICRKRGILILAAARGRNDQRAAVCFQRFWRGVRARRLYRSMHRADLDETITSKKAVRFSENNCQGDVSAASEVVPSCEVDDDYLNPLATNSENVPSKLVPDSIKPFGDGQEEVLSFKRCKKDKAACRKGSAFGDVTSLVCGDFISAMTVCQGDALSTLDRDSPCKATIADNTLMSRDDVANRHDEDDLNDSVREGAPDTSFSSVEAALDKDDTMEIVFIYPVTSSGKVKPEGLESMNIVERDVFESAFDGLTGKWAQVKSECRCSQSEDSMDEDVSLFRT